jgi:hypothetical protein
MVVTCLLCVPACGRHMGLDSAEPAAPAVTSIQPGGDASAELKRVWGLSSFGIAHEIEPACELQAAPYTEGQGFPLPEQFVPVQPNALANTFYGVLDRAYYASAVTLLVADTEANRLWLRNRPAPHAEEASIRWNCAVSTERIAGLKPRLSRKFVRLDASRCTALTPILGTGTDLSTSTYTVTDVSLFVGLPRESDGGWTQGAVTVGIRVEAEGGAKRLTVPSSDFDECFVGADRSPPLPAEVEALREWLALKSPDVVAPPPVSLETVEAVMGVQRERCREQQFVGRSGLECRVPLLRQQNATRLGPFGTRAILLVRERAVDGLYFADGRLISPTEAVTMSAQVRLQGIRPRSSFARSFRAALDTSMADKQLQVRRATQARFRLLAPQASGEQATHSISVAVEYEIPKLEVLYETREHAYVAGTRREPNPAHAKARRAVADARGLLASAEQELEILERRLARAEQLCEAGASARAAPEAAGDGVVRWIASSVRSAAVDSGCNEAARAKERAVVQARIASAQQQLAAAEHTAANTPETVQVDIKRTRSYRARRFRRTGVARAEIAISPAHDEGRVELRYTAQVPFGAFDIEIPRIPEIGLRGTLASPPTAEDAEEALAKALVGQLDRAVAKWGVEREVGEDSGPVQPGTRSWMVLVARQAASNRAVRLLSDLLENRPQQLAKASLSFRVRMPDERAGRCFVFGAIAVGGGTDVNLTLRRARGKAMTPVARDVRADPDASFEVCDLPSGGYDVVVDTHGAVPEGILVSMFESTPGRVSKADVSRATLGIPAMPRPDTLLYLNGTGRVWFKGAGGRVVKGRTGDRDGDGIADDADRCPYDPEIQNAFLDDDGCPDEASTR